MCVCVRARVCVVHGACVRLRNGGGSGVCVGSVYERACVRACVNVTICVGRCFTRKH